MSISRLLARLKRLEDQKAAPAPRDGLWRAIEAGAQSVLPPVLVGIVRKYIACESCSLEFAMPSRVTCPDLLSVCSECHNRYSHTVRDESGCFVCRRGPCIDRPLSALIEGKCKGCRRRALEESAQKTATAFPPSKRRKMLDLFRADNRERFPDVYADK